MLGWLVAFRQVPAARWCGYLGGLILGLSLWGPLTGQAAEMTDVMSAPQFHQTNGNAFGPGNSIDYPTLTAVTANQTQNNRLTTKTTKIAITFADTVAANGSSSFLFDDFHFDVMQRNPNPDQPGLSLVTAGATNLSNHTSKINFGRGKTQTLTVDLTKLQQALPIYIGFRFVASTMPQTAVTYQFGYFTSDPAIQLKPTIAGTLRPTDTVIRGTGTTVGDQITNSVNGITTVVGPDKTYTLDLGESLTAASQVTVTERNSMGDYGTATAMVVVPKLMIMSLKSQVAIQPDDLATLTDDSALVAWVVQQASIVATNPMVPNDDITYIATTDKLASQLQALSAGQSLAVAIRGQNKAGVQSDPLTIMVTKQAGQLSFGAVSPALVFGTLTIPARETVFQPQNTWEVNVNDTRAQGANWYIYANATAMTAKSQPLKGDLIYRDHTSQQILTNRSTLIATGTRTTATTTKVTTTAAQRREICLDVQPGVYAADYQGTVNWSLQDTPAA
ncbi:cell surface protein [Lactobacillus sp. CBA3606]|uniref:WxL domain-containing protein n=1 Tax=Lactobacillus sp. CBA3606 TaxID=2099789 RepID=UPI000CFC9023|nr:WxL domain-containing protein [Lactobacillus sp. CBA3606]AVK63764.1 cell surface protein [Lactobacillus sp. CBA3606]